MNNILLFIGTVLVVALAALFAVPHFVDWSTYRSAFETQAGKLVGRDVRVGGRVSLRLLPTPYVAFENVRVADQDGVFSEPPLRVEAFTMWLAIAPLLRGAVEASEVDLRQPEFLLRMQDRQPGRSALTDAPVVGLPMNVALRSVNVHDGVVRVLDASGNETLKVDKITGEFSAASLEGPFRFRGSLAQSGRARDLRISTGKIETDGSVSVDGSLRVVEQASVVQLKGRVATLMTDPSFAGDMLVQPAADRSKARDGTRDEILPFYEIKSKVRLGLRDAKLDDLTILFEQAGRPQMMNGSASATFGEPKTFSAALNARWLDLDHITGTQGKSGPHAGIARLAGFAEAWLPTGIATSLRLGIEQATLGGDTINRVDIALQQTKDRLEISRLSADVPGGSRIKLAGGITGLAPRSMLQALPGTDASTPAATSPPGARPGAPSMTTAPAEAALFQGPFHLHGQNLTRFLAWAAPGSNLHIQEGAGAFSLAGTLSLGRGRVGVTGMRGEVAATAFEGEASLTIPQAGPAPATQPTPQQAQGAGRGRPELYLSIDSDRLDLRPVLSGTIKLDDVWRALHGKPEAATAAAASAGGPTRKGAPAAAEGASLAARMAAINSETRLRIGKLMLPEIELRDVDADVSRTDLAATVRALRFTTSNGIRVQADGQLHAAEGRTRGALKTVVEVEHPAALSALVRFVDMPEAKVLEPRAAQVLPLRLAGIVTLGVRGGTGFELLIDGAAQDTRTSLVVRGDQEPHNWRTAVLDVTGTLDTAKSGQLLGQLLPGMTPPSIGGSEHGRLSVRANGVPETGISTAIEFESKAVDAGFSGVLALSATQASMSGEIGLKAADVADGLRLVGLKGVRALHGRDLVLHARMAAKGGDVQLASATLRLGSASAEAKGTMTRRDKRLEVDLKIKAADASLPAVLAVAAGAGPGGALPPADGGTGTGVWPDDAIDLTALGEIGGKVRLEASVLSLGQGLELQQAVAEFEVTPSAIELKELSGDALGGRVSATGRVEAGQGGVSLKGSAKVDGAMLDRIAASPGAPPAATGLASAYITFAGRGLTPRGVIGTLTGKGALQLKDARLAKFGSEALEAAVTQVLSPAGEGGAVADRSLVDGRLEPAAFNGLIASQLAKAPLAIGTRTVPLEIADGALRAKSMAFDVARGHVKTVAYVDLSTLRIDSEWTIETVGRFEARKSGGGDAGGKGPQPASLQIPGISLVVVGPVAELGRLTPRVNSDALARELLVRHMERDVEQLERDRKKREEEEAQRQKLRDLDKAEAERKAEQAGAAAKDAAQAASQAAVTLGPPPSGAVPQAPVTPPATSVIAVPAPMPILPPAAGDARREAPVADGQVAGPSVGPSSSPSTGAPAAAPAASEPSTSQPVPPASRARQDRAASPPPRAARPPASIFDQTRGL